MGGIGGRLSIPAREIVRFRGMESDVEDDRMDGGGGGGEASLILASSAPPGVLGRLPVTLRSEK